MNETRTKKQLSTTLKHSDAEMIFVPQGHAGHGIKLFRCRYRYVDHGWMIKEGGYVNKEELGHIIEILKEIHEEMSE